MEVFCYRRNELYYPRIILARGRLDTQHLLDRGHISFTDHGRLLISQYLNPSVVRAWGLDSARPPYPFRPEQCRYLDFHRRELFETVHAGRRA